MVAMDSMTQKPAPVPMVVTYQYGGPLLKWSHESAVKVTEGPMEGGRAEDGGHGHPVSPERQSWGSEEEALGANHPPLSRCQKMLNITMQISPYAKLLLDAMKQSGCAVSKDRHFACEDCNGSVSGGFDADTSEIVLCQNNINNQDHMNRVVTHELIHAFDHCRAHVDWFNNVQHLACSEIRAANLSGDCSINNEISRFKFGFKQHHQVCVRERALRSILAVRDISREAAEKAVDGVFNSCFNDHEPFGRIPHCNNDVDRAYRDFKNRNRYPSDL